MGLSDFAGGQGLRFFKILPKYVVKSKPAGSTPLPIPTFGSWLQSAVTLRHMWASPNTVWVLIAIAFYVLFPYDLSPTSTAAQGPLTVAFFQERLPLWFAVTMGYTGFWHVTLYFLGWAERPFIRIREYRVGKILHNLLYSTSGIVIWTGFDNLFAYLWATGKLPYLSDADAFATTAGFLRFIFGLVAIPLWRDAHFYFAHRFLHFRPIFQQVHSLHHRNTDIEPFSGLCMHPVEHLYYYACVLPSVFCLASPFHMLWNGVHLLLSPGASHSGFEDHLQSDAFHYYHHRYFENNYAGFSAGVLDVWFGTYFGGGWKENTENISVREDSKASLGSTPELQFVAYLALSAACVGAWEWCASPLTTPRPSNDIGFIVSVLAGFGPVFLAVVFLAMREGLGTMTAPFQKHALWVTALHVVVGTLMTSVPITRLCYLAFA